MKIGIITNDDQPVFQKQVIAGIQQYTATQNCRVQVATTGRAQADLDSVALDFDSLAGVLVIANALSDESLHELVALRRPISLVSHQLPDAALPAVMPDNAGGIAQLVAYLVEDCGSRRIAFIQGDLQQNDGQERRRAFLQALLRHGLNPDERLLLRGDFIREVAQQSTEELLASRQPFDALAAADYVMAVAALEVLRSHGLRVPAEVCVVGFGDGPEAAANALTTVGVDVEQIGMRAARQLLGQVRGHSIQGVTLLATRLVERATCRRIP